MLLYPSGSRCSTICVQNLLSLYFIPNVLKSGTLGSNTSVSVETDIRVKRVAIRSMECAGAEPKSVPSPTSVSPHHSDLSRFITCVFSVRSLSDMPAFLNGLEFLTLPFHESDVSKPNSYGCFVLFYTVAMLLQMQW